MTDANVVLGRVVPEYFPSIFGPKENEPLDVEGARAAFVELTNETHQVDRVSELIRRRIVAGEILRRIAVQRNIKT